MVFYLWCGFAFSIESRSKQNGKGRGKISRRQKEEYILKRYRWGGGNKLRGGKKILFILIVKRESLWRWRVIAGV